MSRKLLVSVLLAASLAGGTALADEPSLHQVYQTAESGRLDDAQAMMRDVLKHHPDSGKAHYVEAELLAKQGQTRQAAAELATAERLAPGLAFAKPESVRELRQLVGGSVQPAAVHPAVQPVADALGASPARGASFPWNLLLIGGGVLVFIAVVSRMMRPQAQTAYAGGGAGGLAPAGGAPMPYGTGPASPPADAGPGLGSRVMGGLATGAAVGAGMVAGEALMHHFLDKNDTPASPKPLTSDPNPLGLGTPVIGNDLDDMGGTDFGISDAGSWDDSGGGSDDWN